MPAMVFHLHTVIPGLQPYVKSICSMEYNEDEEGASFRVLPDTCVEMFVNYGPHPVARITAADTTEEKGSFITSRMSRYMDVQMHAGSGCIAICFHPGMAYRFFPVGMAEVSNQVCDLALLWKQHAHEMAGRMAEAADNTARVETIQTMLQHALARNGNEDPRMQHCLAQVRFYKGRLRVKALAEKASVSQRQLARRFNDCVGLSPKEFTRMSRFIHALELMKGQQELTLTQVACDSGYYDQSHFIHDCREYAGLSPGDLTASKGVLY